MLSAPLCISFALLLPSRGHHKRCEAGILTGGPEKREEKSLVSMFSISDQTDTDHQYSTGTTYPELLRTEISL